MSILLIHASIEGQTAKVARYMRDLLEAEGPPVTMVDTEAAVPKIDFAAFDHIVLAAPVHERTYPDGFEAFAAGHKNDLATKPTLMLAVSLAAAFPEKLEDAWDFQQEFQMRTGFIPDEVQYVGGAVRPSSYGYFESQIMRYVVLHGVKVDASTEREFTDWEAIRQRTLQLATP